MKEKEFTWHKIAEHISEIDFQENNIGIAELNGTKICLAKYKDQVFAIAYRCPHASGLLSEGYIDSKGNIVCPVHRYKYDLSCGRNTSGEGYYLKNWPVEMRDDGVYIKVEKEQRFWNLF